MEKLEWCDYSMVQKFWWYFLFVLTEFTNVADTHTHTQRDTAWRRIASRGKNLSNTAISSCSYRCVYSAVYLVLCCSYAFIGTHTHRQCCRYYSDAWHLECLVVNWLSTVSGHVCWWWCRQLNRHMSRVHSSRVSLQDADEASNASTGSARSSSSVSQLQCRSETR